MAQSPTQAAHSTVRSELPSFGRHPRAENKAPSPTDEACKALNAEQGTYSWTHANDQLTLTKQNDACAERVGALDGRAFKPST